MDKAHTAFVDIVGVGGGVRCCKSDFRRTKMTGRGERIRKTIHRILPSLDNFLDRSQYSVRSFHSPPKHSPIYRAFEFYDFNIIDLSCCLAHACRCYSHSPSPPPPRPPSHCRVAIVRKSQRQREAATHSASLLLSSTPFPVTTFHATLAIIQNHTQINTCSEYSRTRNPM